MGDASWLSEATLLIRNTAIITALVIVLLCWRFPIFRAFALVNFSCAIAGNFLMRYVATFPRHELLYDWYFASATVNFSKSLLILVLISWNVRYLCKTSMQLVGIFTFLGLFNVLRFFDRYVLDERLEMSLFSTYYTVVVPALNFLALLVLASPVVFYWLKSSNSEWIQRILVWLREGKFSH